MNGGTETELSVPSNDHPRDGVYLELEAERLRQDKRWGEQNHPDGTGLPIQARMAVFKRKTCETKFRHGEGAWADILMEEVAEALAESDPSALRAELVQVAAVSLAWVEAIDRRNT